MDILFFKNYNSFFFSNYRLKNYLLKILCKWIFKLTDVLSVETEDARDYLLMIYPELKDKLICIPNGVDSDYLEREIALKAFEEKENIIITVGRIGTVQKNTELFLEALKITDLNDWKIYIIGPIEKHFKEYINNFFIENPELEYKIIFQGNITDRKVLFEWYNRAKIFCLTSRFEGFPITFPEALYFGNYIVTSHVSSAEQIVYHGRYGTIVKADAVEFSKVLQNCMKAGFLNDGRFKELRNYSKDNYTWSVIIKKLADKLNS
jgi:glycosyltransferase involved in cell wall biosynthesis